LEILAPHKCIIITLSSLLTYLFVQMDLFRHHDSYIDLFRLRSVLQIGALESFQSELLV
jgi:hypothetical protein